jgi:hypothetical protein
MSEFPFEGPEKPAEEVRREGRQRYDWPKILAAIHVGKARKIKVKADTAKAAIHRLKLEDEYDVISRKRETWILRKSHQ